MDHKRFMAQRSLLAALGFLPLPLPPDQQLSSSLYPSPPYNASMTPPPPALPPPPPALPPCELLLCVEIPVLTTRQKAIAEKQRARREIRALGANVPDGAYHVEADSFDRFRLERVIEHRTNKAKDAIEDIQQEILVKGANIKDTMPVSTSVRGRGHGRGQGMGTNGGRTGRGSTRGTSRGGRGVANGRGRGRGPGRPRGSRKADPCLVQVRYYRPRPNDDDDNDDDSEEEESDEGILGTRKPRQTKRLKTIHNGVDLAAHQVLDQGRGNLEVTSSSGSGWGLGLGKGFGRGKTVSFPASPPVKAAGYGMGLGKGKGLLFMPPGMVAASGTPSSMSGSSSGSSSSSSSRFSSRSRSRSSSGSRSRSRSNTTSPAELDPRPRPISPHECLQSAGIGDCQISLPSDGSESELEMFEEIAVVEDTPAQSFRQWTLKDSNMIFGIANKLFGSPTWSSILEVLVNYFDALPGEIEAEYRRLKGVGNKEDASKIRSLSSSRVWWVDGEVTMSRTCSGSSEGSITTASEKSLGMTTEMTLLDFLNSSTTPSDVLREHDWQGGSGEQFMSDIQ